MKKNVQINFKVDQELNHELDQLKRWLPSFANDRSAILRFLIRREAATVFDAPYIASESNHFVYIARDGSGFMFSREDLYLNTERIWLPKSVRMKPEQVATLLAELRPEEDLRSRMEESWLLNHFAVWDRNYPAGKALDSRVDRTGLFLKFADLEVRSEPKSTLTREVIVGARDFVQRKRSQPDRPKGYPSPDRIGIAVILPTTRFQVQILLDLRLYEGFPETQQSVALGYELRNPEGAVFRARPASELPPEWREGRRPRSGEATVEELAVSRTFAAFSGRLKALAEGVEPSTGRAIVEDKSVKRKLRAIKAPDEYLYGQLTWEAPYVGTEISITWNRPG